MEKLRFYLQGKEFDLITDHKAIEELKRKKECGSARIQRWFDRLERFQFDIKYRKGNEMISSDALSRAYSTTTNLKKEKEEKEVKILDDEKILHFHRDLNHRNNIQRDLIKSGFIITSERLKKILQEFLICKMKDKKYGKTCIYVQSEAPGDKIGIDLLEVTRGDRIVLAIDCFSRKLFGKTIGTKEPKKLYVF